ncbi:hypothetical protein J2S00_001245 [Caldalkalibacillus uzonensis]|uniref:Uncharacterized protein n=1 Tax=Caldalkalibacillus uzonensis TaxID=353224 RepID=A0ABU0CRG6_9BACI|nr:hypothetical protein [Caldalkalibacillus uzonensis]MDQ0338461.1 hypothetical protein [Caldalkalibacillus uzonensis]
MTTYGQRYPGIAVVGGENTSALYGVDNGIVDWQGVGIQHFFYQTYEHDLIHSAVTFLKHPNGELEIGNRKINGKSHPIHQHPQTTSTKEGYLFQTRFKSQVNKRIGWQEEVFATEKNKIVFETTLFNENSQTVQLETGGYVILRNPGGGKAIKTEQGVIWTSPYGSLIIAMEQVQKININVESPTGFVWQTMQNLLTETETPAELQTSHFIGVTLSCDISIPAHSQVCIRWGIAVGGEPGSLNQAALWDWDHERSQASAYWRQWLHNGVEQSLHLPSHIRSYYHVNLIALKASLLGGFVPADITGHYYSKGSPCYYARDAMMIARSFLLSGHYKEAQEIMDYLIQRATKDGTGEFYQRYDAQGKPREGANNNVFHQLDSQGYFLRNVLTYFQRTGEWLLSLDEIKPYVEVLRKYRGKHGLIGPEGGVNEGVFGPAYITSSNMFIYGGLMAAADMAELHGDNRRADSWRKLAKDIQQGIESTWLENEGRYGYGYVTYSDEVVKKYDTPQYFAPLYGYPLNERMQKNNRFLLEHASFFGHGIGYTEQEYHHGPWLFNTAACAQFQALIGDAEQYEAKINWLLDHANGYGLMPEAIDAQNEQQAFINPLTWACAEFVSAISILSTEDGFNYGRLAVCRNLWEGAK